VKEHPVWSKPSGRKPPDILKIWERRLNDNFDARSKNHLGYERLMKHKPFRWICRFSLLLVISLTSETDGALSVAKIFSDHMVVQRQLPVPIWGTATPGGEVSVVFADKTTKAVAGADGKWQAVLEPLQTDSGGRELRVASGSDSLVIKDVVVGEVWFAGGQSNMQFTAGTMAKRLPPGETFVSSANLPGIRFCRIQEPAAAVPREDLAVARWDSCTPQTAANHSAVALVFARRLHLELGVPVGVIDSSVGGTPIEPYIPEDAFVGHPTLEKLRSFARSGDRESIAAMPGGTYVRGDHWLAGRLYNGRIAPVVPYAIRGAIWYQGESNCGTGEDPRDYEFKLRALISGWRSAWKRADLPVYVVQLPQWKSYAWTFLREEQRRAVAATEHSGLVVTIDLNHANDIHPPNKIDVGERLARWPLARIHNRDVAVQGPVFRSAETRDTEIIASFENSDEGLMAAVQAGPGQPVTDSGQTEVFGCELCDAAGVWYPAQARIDGARLVATSLDVPSPVAVRYACWPEAAVNGSWNLFGKSGLPAAPFCSDWKRMPYDPAKNPR
jgi:sialate O-acetylesterase